MKRLTILSAAVLVLAAATPLQAGDGGWELRGFGVWVDPGLSDTVPTDDDTLIHIGSSTEVGFGLGLEYGLSDRLGVELGVLTADPGVDLTLDVPEFGLLVLEDSLSTTALLLDLNVHLTPPDSRVDLYIGGGIANVSFGSLRFVAFDDELAVSVGDDTTWTIKAGLDIPFGDSGWGVTLGVRHIDAEFEAREREDEPGDNVTFDNSLLIATAGFVYSFD